MTTLVVSDLRQYEYCARIPYFTHVLGLSRARPTTYKMQEGLLEHQHAEELEERRSLRSYGLTEGERVFNVYLHSSNLQLSGLLDMVILTNEEAIPIEFKNDMFNRVNKNHLIQLAAYTLLIEERWERPVKRAFVHFIPTKQSREVAITDQLRTTLFAQLDRLRFMIEGENLPNATQCQGRCTDCEFRNFCPDTW